MKKTFLVIMLAAFSSLSANAESPFQADPPDPNYPDPGLINNLHDAIARLQPMTAGVITECGLHLVADPASGTSGWIRVLDKDNVDVSSIPYIVRKGDKQAQIYEQHTLECCLAAIWVESSYFQVKMRDQAKRSTQGNGD
jgi:hypothetical protein